MANCSFPELAPGGVDCSGNGVCALVSNVAVCTCDKGWNGIGDFTLESQDCDQYDIAIKILWAFTAAFNTLVLLQGCFYIWVMTRVTKRIQFKTFWFVALMVVHNILMIAVSLTKALSDGVVAIGDDPAVTVLFSISVGIWWSLGLETISRFANIFSMQAIKLGSKIKVVALPRVFMQFNIFIFAFSPCMCLFDKNNCSAYGRLHFLSIVPAMIGLGVYWNNKFTGQLIEDLEQAQNVGMSHNVGKTNEKRLNSVNDLLIKLKYLKKTIREQATTNIIIALLMGSWAFLLRKASYQLPIAWISASAISFACVKLICNNESASYKSKGGSSVLLRAPSSFISISKSNSKDENDGSGSKNESGSKPVTTFAIATEADSDSEDV